jgi:ABC-type multidrug transport system fused ATPase/permease subunit
MVVKAFNLVEAINERFHIANTQALKKSMGVARLRAMIDGVTFPLAMAPFILGMGLGGYFIFHGRLTFGALFAFINLLNWVVNPMGSVPEALASIAEAAGAGRRVLELIDEPAERQTGAAFQPNGSIYAVRFNNVTFSYAGPDAPVLKNVSIDVIKGETVAVVGPSGSGKSTLVKLILGYYSMPDNAVEVLGHDENQWKLPAARDQMAFVAQDTYLFPISIGENIGLGKPGSTQEEIEGAARAANIHDFIASLPQGYKTPAGEWGSRLSGGQKQRISLARAILKDAPILLLDEPTSALDTESEALVQQALDAFTAEKNRTTVVIAHRLSTIKNANRVVVIDGGQVVEQGTHDELLAKGGAYTELYQSQFSSHNGSTGAAAFGD